MKKVNFKICFRAFLATFCLLFLGVVGVNAQSKAQPGQVQSQLSTGNGTGGSNLPAVLATPAGNFMPTEQANATLGQQMLALKAQIEQLTPGSALYAATELKYNYYSAAQMLLQKGATVQNAITGGLRFAAVSVDGTVSEATLNILRQDLIALLDA